MKNKQRWELNSRYEYVDFVDCPDSRSRGQHVNTFQGQTEHNMFAANAERSQILVRGPSLAVCQIVSRYKIPTQETEEELQIKAGKENGGVGGEEPTYIRQEMPHHNRALQYFHLCVYVHLLHTTGGTFSIDSMRPQGTMHLTLPLLLSESH